MKQKKEKIKKCQTNYLKEGKSKKEAKDLCRKKFGFKL